MFWLFFLFIIFLMVLSVLIARQNPLTEEEIEKSKGETPSYEAETQPKFAGPLIGKTILKRQYLRDHFDH